MHTLILLYGVQKKIFETEEVILRTNRSIILRTELADSSFKSILHDLLQVNIPIYMIV